MTNQGLADALGITKMWAIQVLLNGATPSPGLAKRIERLSGGRIVWTEFFEHAGSPVEAA